MPRPVIDVEVRSEEFERFASLFGAFRQHVDEQPEAFKKLQDAMGSAMGSGAKASEEAKNGFAMAAAQASLIGEGLKRGVSAGNELARSGNTANRALSGVAKTAGGLAKSIFGIATSVLKLGAAGLGLGALSSIGSFFGLGGLADAAFNRQKDAGGLGISPGRLAAFKDDAQDLLGVQALQGAANAQSDVRNSGALSMMGLNFADAQKATPDNLALTMLERASIGFAQAQKQGIGGENSTAAMGYKMLNGDMNDVRRVAMDPLGLAHGLAKIERDRAQINRDAPGLEMGNVDGLVEFKKQLGRAADAIQTDLIKTLGPLAKPLTQLSEDLVGLAGQVLGSKAVQEAVKDGAQSLADFLTKTDWKKFGEEITNVTGKIGDVIHFFGMSDADREKAEEKWAVDALTAPSNYDPSKTNKTEQRKWGNTTEEFDKQVADAGKFIDDNSKGPFGLIGHFVGEAAKKATAFFTGQDKLPGLAALWEKAGGDPKLAALAAATADAESGGNRFALNDNRDKHGNLLSQDHGLWQINDVHADMLKKAGLKNWKTDPLENAKAAVLVSGNKNFDPWTTYGEFKAGKNTPASKTITKDLESMRGSDASDMAKAVKEHTAMVKKMNAKKPHPVSVMVYTPSDAYTAKQMNAASYA